MKNYNNQTVSSLSLSISSMSWTVLVMMATLSVLSSYSSTTTTTTTYAFHLNMVASRSSRGSTSNGIDKLSQLGAAAASRLPIGVASGGITGNVISQMAVMALKRRLKGQTHVACDVTADAQLLRGRIGPVTVKGRGWQSTLGLTCRAIEATVDTCELDISRIISKQKLVLTTPAIGRAMVALDATDFGHFITHPLMRPPGIPMADDNTAGNDKLQFLPNDVTIDPISNTITFYGDYQDAKWKFMLKRAASSSSTQGGNNGSAMVTTELVSTRSNDNDHHEMTYYAEMARQLSQTTSTFFNEMVFELDGTFLTFQDMMITAKGQAPSVMLALNIKVHKFPSPGLEF